MIGSARENSQRFAPLDEPVGESAPRCQASRLQCLDNEISREMFLQSKKGLFTEVRRGNRHSDFC